MLEVILNVQYTQHLSLLCLKLLTDSLMWVSGSWTIHFAFLWRKGILSFTLSGFAPRRQRVNTVLPDAYLPVRLLRFPRGCVAWPGDLLAWDSICDRTYACFLPDPWILFLLPGH